MGTYGHIVRCRFDNAKLAADLRVNCLAAD